METYTALKASGEVLKPYILFAIVKVNRGQLEYGVHQEYVAGLVVTSSASHHRYFLDQFNQQYFFEEFIKINYPSIYMKYIECPGTLQISKLLSIPELKSVVSRLKVKRVYDEQQLVQVHIQKLKRDSKKMREMALNTQIV